MKLINGEQIGVLGHGGLYLDVSELSPPQRTALLIWATIYERRQRAALVFEPGRLPRRQTRPQRQHTPALWQDRA